MVAAGVLAGGVGHQAVEAVAAREPNRTELPRLKKLPRAYPKVYASTAAIRNSKQAEPGHRRVLRPGGCVCRSSRRRQSARAAGRGSFDVAAVRRRPPGRAPVNRQPQRPRPQRMRRSRSAPSWKRRRPSSRRLRSRRFRPRLRRESRRRRLLSRPCRRCRRSRRPTSACSAAAPTGATSAAASGLRRLRPDSLGRWESSTGETPSSAGRPGRSGRRQRSRRRRSR